MTQSPMKYTDSQVVGIARRVTWVGFVVNALLGGLKIAAGIIGRSGAMVADGVHSLTDFVTDLIVIVMIGVSRWKANKVYQYGYGKYETFATLLIGVALAFVAVGLFWHGLHEVLRAIHGELPPEPGMIALWMAIISIAAKEWLFHYTRNWGRRIDSTSVIANAWHHRSDAISSVATLVGVGGAILLGSHWRILDPVAAMIVSVFIAVSSLDIARPAVRELLEVALPPDVTEPLMKIIKSTSGVITYHHFRSRRNGPRIIIDVHVKVDPDISVKAGHEIASQVERNLKNGFGNAMIANIHIEPYRNQPVHPDGSCDD